MTVTMDYHERSIAGFWRLNSIALATAMLALVPMTPALAQDADLAQ